MRAAEREHWVAGRWGYVLKYAAILAAGGFAFRLVMVTGWTIFSGFLVALVASYLVFQVGKDLTVHRQEGARRVAETGQEGDVRS